MVGDSQWEGKKQRTKKKKSGERPINWGSKVKKEKKGKKKTKKVEYTFNCLEGNLKNMYKVTILKH